MKKQPDPKEKKPEPPYLAVWFEIYKIGASVQKKTNWSPKGYIREPKCWYFPIGEEPQAAMDEIFTAYGTRDGAVLQMAHQFAMIHSWRKINKDGSVETAPVQPIK